MSSELGKTIGRIYPFSYRRLQEPDGAFTDLLRAHSQKVWLLDIRLDPEGDAGEWPQYRGEWLRQWREEQYRHAKGLGMLDGRLYHPESAIRKILEMMEQNESFVLLSDFWEHVQEVEHLVRERAGEQGIILEDPYAFHPGDLCMAQTGRERVEVILHHRHIDVYSFGIDPRDPDWHGSISPIDVRNLQLVEQGAYLCVECGRGAASVKWREKPEKKMCRNCFWRWDLAHGDA